MSDCEDPIIILASILFKLNYSISLSIVIQKGAKAFSIPFTGAH